MSEKTTFARNLEYFLSVTDHTRADLYNTLGINKSTVSRWINDGIVPDMKMLDKVSDFLGVPKSVLISERTCSEDNFYFDSFCNKLKKMNFTKEQLDILLNIASQLK